MRNLVFHFEERSESESHFERMLRRIRGSKTNDAAEADEGDILRERRWVFFVLSINSRIINQDG
jgi:hypothetical protein